MTTMNAPCEKVGHKHILVVEDDDSIRELMQMTLELKGYDVSTAANGQEALDLLNRITRPCLILLDLMMPVMDGWKFIENLQSSLSNSTIPIVVVTAFGCENRPVKAQAVLTKPIDIQSLFNTVQSYCSL